MGRESMAQFLSMGGYAEFVWPAYAVATAVMLGVLVESIRSLRMRERELEALGDTSGER